MKKIFIFLFCWMVCAGSAFAADEVCLYHAIKYLHPDAKLEKDFAIQNDTDGKGDYIQFWNEATLGPRPTDGQIANAKSAYTNKATLDKAAEQNKREALISKLGLTSEDLDTLKKTIK
jgi:hypothetical protein